MSYQALQSYCKCAYVFLFFVVCSFAGLCHAAPSSPTALTFDELITLSQQAQPDAVLQQKLAQLLATPVVENRQTVAKNRAVPGLLRITEWNLERGQNFDDIQQLLKSPQTFFKRVQTKRKLPPAALDTLEKQAATLRSSDVLILNEVDIGVKRTDYRNVVRDLASLLGMNSVYAVEFVEVDGLEDLGTEPAVLDSADLSARMTQDLKPDPSRYQGLHVNAILSRYPLSNAHVIQLPVCHDWFVQEKQEISQLEKAKRGAANLIFLERMEREVRRGNRSALVADISMPAAGGSQTSVRLVNAHLENKCKADCRKSQMQAILESVRGTTQGLILAGDLNTTGSDGTPTSVRYELSSRVKDYQFWVSNLLRFTPVGAPFYATASFNFWKNFRDPTALHIPVIGQNPEAALFSSIRSFHFEDGARFDFAGVKTRNLQKSGKTLSDSNERAGKGFVPTFSMNRDFGGIIKFRLDWLFVKPPGALNDPAAMKAFYPEMPQTLQALNSALAERLSDHAPISALISTKTVESKRRLKEPLRSNAGK